jgi:23S rRNA (adenine2030-N6)-methyltransferase
MNYKHAFHAGSHTEVFKHSVLALLLSHLVRNEKPFFVLDTHAGAGIYDLTSEETAKTGEADNGIGQILSQQLITSAPYLDVIRKLNGTALRFYPGSPALIQSFLRDRDRLIACELHEQVFIHLRSTLRNDHRISIHRRDGYEAIKAFLPPPERRGVIFVDPPFEAKDEFQKLGEALCAGIRKWPTGIFAAWYPIKRSSAVKPLIDKLKSSGIPKSLSARLLLFPENDTLLAGSGMIICNPPWLLENSLKRLCAELLNAFRARQGHSSVEWLSREK